MIANPSSKSRNRLLAHALREKDRVSAQYADVRSRIVKIDEVVWVPAFVVQSDELGPSIEYYEGY